MLQVRKLAVNVHRSKSS